MRGGARRRLRGGYSMIELLVALGIGLIVVLALGHIVLASQRSWTWGREKVTLQANMAQALEQMERAAHKARWITVPDSNQFRVFDENGVRRTAYRRVNVGGRWYLQEGGHVLVPPVCTRFRVQPNNDTTCVVITLRLVDAYGNVMVGRTTATVRNRTLAY